MLAEVALAERADDAVETYSAGMRSPARARARPPPGRPRGAARRALRPARSPGVPAGGPPLGAPARAGTHRPDGDPPARTRRRPLRARAWCSRGDAWRGRGKPPDLPAEAARAPTRARPIELRAALEKEAAPPVADARAGSWPCWRSGRSTLLLFSFAAGPDAGALRRHAPGFLWLALMLSSTLALSETFQRRAGAAGPGRLLLLPAFAAGALLRQGAGQCDPAHIARVWRWSRWPSCCTIFLLPRPFALLGAPSCGRGRAVRARVRCTPRMGVPGTGTPDAAAVAALPVGGAGAPFSGQGDVPSPDPGDPMGQLRSWLLLLVSFDAIYWSLCGLLFDRVVDE